MPTILTIWIAKLILGLSRGLGRGGGSALPGLVAEKLNKNIGARLAKKIPHGSIIITGTNGKTTTSKMIAQILDEAGIELVANRAGSNLSRGVVSALVEHTNGWGKVQGDMGLFEVDEAAMPAVAAMLQPKIIVVLNLFRDQLDRYGELDSTATLIGRGIAATKAQVYLNADDPLVASLSKYVQGEQRVHYFGLDDVPTKKLAHDVTADSTNCPVCGQALVYSKNFFGHVGHYHCGEGHFDRPNPSIEASHIELEENGSSFKINTGSTKAPAAHITLPGVYNVYNAIAAYSVGHQLGIESTQVISALARADAAFGRVEKIDVAGKELYLLLIKNPTGFNQIIQTFLLHKKQQKLLIIINDNFADGRDVSWLWDVAFEELAGQEHQISISGIRAADLALRLKYGGIDSHQTETDISQAVNNFIAQLDTSETGYIIPTYTAMLETRKLLGKQSDLQENWK